MDQSLDPGQWGHPSNQPWGDPVYSNQTGRPLKGPFFN